MSELARYQAPTSREWWRITRDGESRNCHLESISERSLERSLSWAYACALTIERNEFVNDNRVRAEMEAYCAMQARARNKVEGPCCVHSVERHAYNGCADCGCGVLWTEHPDRDLDMSQAALDARAFRLNKVLYLSKVDREHAVYGCLAEDIDKALEGKEPRDIAQYALERLSDALALIRPSPYAGCTVANHDADELREFINIAKYAIDKAVPR